MHLNLRVSYRIDRIVVQLHSRYVPGQTLKRRAAAEQNKDAESYIFNVCLWLHPPPSMVVSS